MRGHLRERSPGHWAIVIDVRDPATGRRKRKWHSFAGTKREAQIECARLICEAQGGGSVDLSRETVAGFIDRFVRDWVTVNVSARTAERYRQLLDHVRRHLRERPLQKVRPEELAALYATLSRSGMAPRTISHVHSVLFQALGQAKVWKVVRDNVAEAVRPPPVPDKELPILQPDRAREMLGALRRNPLYLLASLALATGMRRNELLALRWRDVDLDAGRLRVELALEETGVHGIRTKAPKTKNGRRTIALPTHIVMELRHHWREQQEQRLALGMGKAPADSPILATIEGKPQSPNTITKAWPRAMAAIGMPEITLHSLRHTHASMLIASGMDVLTISRRLGHGSPTITLRVYGHLIHGTDDRAAQIMDAAFGNGSSSVAERAQKTSNIAINEQIGPV
jgi:integrase